MTEYQKIANELFRLGWFPVQGKGDHVKFTKEDETTQIIVSRSITHASRAVANQYALIRRIEPRFQLGKLASHMKPIPPNELPEDDHAVQVKTLLPEWLEIGKTVRWLAPEQYDVRKMTDPQSVMNRKYQIIDYQMEDDIVQKVIISDNESNPFAVQIRELASYEMGHCAKCHNFVPLSMMRKDGNDNLVCEKCWTKNGQKKEEDSKTGNPKDALASFTDLFDIPEEYHDVPLGKLPKDILEKIVANAKKMLKKMTPRDRKKFLYKLPDLVPFIEDTEAKSEESPTTPYQAWRKVMTDLTEEKAELIKEAYGHKKGYTELRSRYNKTSYKLTKLKNKQTDATVNVLEIATFDYGVMLDIWKHAAVFFYAFENVFKKDEPSCLLLINQKEEVRQYIVNTWDGSGTNTLKILEEIVEDKSSLSRAKMDLRLPQGGNIMSKLNDWIKETVGDDEKYIIRSINYTLREKDENDFESAIPYYRILIGVDDAILPQKTKDKLESEMPKLTENFGDFPYSIGFHFMSDENILCSSAKNSHENFGSVFQEYDDQADREEKEPCVMVNRETYGTEPGDTLFKIWKDRDGLLKASYCTLEAQNEEFDEDIRKAIKESICTEDMANGLLLGAADYVKDVVEKFPEQKIKFRKLFNLTNNKMETTNHLDKSNPASDNAAAGALTTRELLRELKARGYAWENLHVSIKIDDEEI